MDLNCLISTTMLAVYGGFISSFRSAIKDISKSNGVKAIDVLIGVLIATAAADYFVPVETPKLAIIVGLIAGSMGGYLMDALQAIAPNLATGIIKILANNVGIKTKDNTNEQK